MSPPLEDRFAGSLIGQALGDALGFVVEGYPPALCRRYVDEVLKAGRAGEVGRAPYPFGQYTDDTQLARELLESYVARKGFDPPDYARRIAAIFAEGRIVGRGRTTEAAAFRLAQGTPWDQAGTPAPAAGNGSAMRAGPVGLMSFDDPDGLIRAARDQGRITHADPRCSAGAVAIAGAVALALDDEVPEPGPFLARLADWAGRIEPVLAGCLGELEGWLALAPEEAVRPIARAGLEEGYREDWEGISPFVVPSVLWSLYA
ncbi:MAG: ADP-ribosylglycohydrolase family protein, partial [Alphaproteobacteria bacterium]